jgi:hypothetical protein
MLIEEIGNKQIIFWCLGCEDVHVCNVNGRGQKGRRYFWNGSMTHPEISPKVINVKGGINNDFCRVEVKNRSLKFSSDSTHWLSGRRVPMVTIPIFKNV